ncbi:MAG: aldo/keto reductase, partial [Pseudomonadota bacterium]
LGKAVMTRRDNFVLASKCVLGVHEGKRGVDGRPEAIAKTLETSLRQLGTDHIDLYYLHRLDKDVPIEESVGALGDAVKAGKIRAIGVSEMSAQTIRRGHAEHPIAAVQSEYSPMVRNPEIAVFDACKELGIGFVAFSPVGRGLLADGVHEDTYKDGDIRNNLPRFNDPQLAHNLKAVNDFNALARDHGYTPAQLAIAWTMAYDDWIVPIPGTRKLAHFKDNMGALNAALPEGLRDDVSGLFEGAAIKGARYSGWMQKMIDTELFEDEEVS